MITASVSIVIVSYNTSDILRECLRAICCAETSDFEIIVVDNASNDGSCDMIRTEFPNVILIQSPTNLGFGAANNLGVKFASRKYSFLLNSDAILKMDTARELAEYLEERPDVSCVGPRIVLPVTGRLQDRAFGYTPTLKRVFMQSIGINRLFPRVSIFNGLDGIYRWDKEMSVGWISGVCMMIRTADFLKVGGFDERIFMYCEDVELCMKLAKLGKVVLYNDFDVMHYGGASSKSSEAILRNGVWQQRNLLAVIQWHQGSLNAVVARIFLAIGLNIRLIAALLKVPFAGNKNNLLLHSSWVRLKDALGIKVSLVGKN